MTLLQRASLIPSGALLYDPCIGSYNFIGMNVPTYRYAKAYNGILNFNQSFLDDLQQLSEDCGFEEVSNS